jgi:hypothetical protein
VPCTNDAVPGASEHVPQPFTAEAEASKTAAVAEPHNRHVLMNLLPGSTFVPSGRFTSATKRAESGPPEAVSFLSLAHLRDSIDALIREYEAKALKLSSSIQTLQLRVDETILSEGDMPTPGLMSLRDQLNGQHLRFPFLRAPHPEYDVAPCPQLLSETDPDYTKVDPAGANAYCSMPDLDRQNEHGDLAVKADGGEEEEDEDAEIVLSFVHVGRDDMYQSTIATIGASVEVARADSALLVPTDLPTPAPSSAPTSSPTDTPTPAPSSAPASSMGQPIFFFVGDIGIEDGARISAGAKFTKTWRLRNDGSDPWPQPLQLMHTMEISPKARENTKPIDHRDFCAQQEAG